MTWSLLVQVLTFSEVESLSLQVPGENMLANIFVITYCYISCVFSQCVECFFTDFVSFLILLFLLELYDRMGLDTF